MFVILKNPSARVPIDAIAQNVDRVQVYFEERRTVYESSYHSKQHPTPLLKEANQSENAEFL